MRMFTGTFKGYNASGAIAPNPRAWRIRTWQAQEGRPERSYWVQSGAFNAVDAGDPLEYLEQSNSISERSVDCSLFGLESQAVMQVIMEWKEDD